ncbi:hypothetical protein ACQ5SO_15710 [Rhodovulum sp. DZ06]|uniref:hypothetical protein n=1 Tax=Rhodovulum sp. DZ06 TaxID=3425126 RepID=UPI003D332BE3
MRALVLLPTALLALAGCAAPRPMTDAERAIAVGALFQPPADRPGIHGIFGVESYGYLSNLEITYFPDEVSDAEVMARADRYCRRHKDKGAADTARSRGAPSDGTVTLSDGTERAARSVWITCTPA